MQSQFSTVEEALKNGWISEYKEYQVLIDVDDIDTYNDYIRVSEITKNWKI